MIEKPRTNSPEQWATCPAAQHKVLLFRLEDEGLHVCRRCMQILAAPCKQKSCTYIALPRSAATSVFQGDDRAPPSRTSNAEEDQAADALNAPVLPGLAPKRELPSLADIILTPLRSSYVNS